MHAPAPGYVEPVAGGVFGSSGRAVVMTESGMRPMPDLAEHRLMDAFMNSLR
jgi:hypothetical protein